MKKEISVEIVNLLNAFLEKAGYLIIETF